MWSNVMTLSDVLKQNPKKIKVVLKKSLIGKIPNHRATLKALGLTKIGRAKIIETQNKALMGMVQKVDYMLDFEVEE